MKRIVYSAIAVLMFLLLLSIAGKAQTNRLECNSEFVKNARSAWMLVRAGQVVREAGFRVDLVDGNYMFSKIYLGDFNKMGLNMDINENTVAIFHTHPNAGVSEPFGIDYNSRVPNYVMSKHGLNVTVPGSNTFTHVMGCSCKEYLQ